MRISELAHQLFLPIENKHFHELSPLSVGFERCKPGKFFGPHVRHYYLIHFVVSGMGIFKNPNGEYRINAGEAFLIRPGENCIYTADTKDPWVYIWLGFDGELSTRFDSAPDVFGYESRVTDDICRAADMETGVEEYLAGVVFKLYATLLGGMKRKDRIKQICDYIDANYMYDIRVDEIADMLHMNRKYLTRIFRDRTGMSIKQYLTDKRLGESKRLLAEGRGVAEVAAMTGYSDSFNFSKAFKSKFGCSPKDYKKGNR